MASKVNFKISALESPDLFKYYVVVNCSKCSMPTEKRQLFSSYYDHCKYCDGGVPLPSSKSVSVSLNQKQTGFNLGDLVSFKIDKKIYKVTAYMWSPITMGTVYNIERFDQNTQFTKYINVHEDQLEAASLQPMQP